MDLFLDIGLADAVGLGGGQPGVQLAEGEVGGGEVDGGWDGGSGKTISSRLTSPFTKKDDHMSTVTRRVIIENALPRRDVDGNIIDAHEGCMERFGDRFYLYGTSYGNTDGYEAAGNRVARNFGQVLAS